MCTGLEVAALISAVAGGASALGVGKGKKVEPEPLMIPGMEEQDYKRIFGKAEELATQQYVAPINDLMKFAYSIPMQYYGGMSPGDITIPGITPMAGGMGAGMGSRTPMGAGGAGGGQAKGGRPLGDFTSPLGGMGAGLGLGGNFLFNKLLGGK